MTSHVAIPPISSHIFHLSVPPIPFTRLFYSFFRQRAETLEDRLSTARLPGPRPIGLHQRPSDVTSSVCAVEKLKGLCLRSGDSCRGQGGTLREHKSCSVWALWEARGFRSGGFTASSVATSTKASIVWGYGIKTAYEVVWRTLNMQLVGTLFVWVWLRTLLCVIRVTDVSLRRSHFRSVRGKQKFLVGQSLWCARRC